MRIRTTDCCSTQKGSGFAMTQEQSKLNECRTLIFCVQDFLARHSLSPESGKDLQMPEEHCSSRLPDWLQTSDLRISSLKMFPDCFRMTKAGRFTPSSVRYLSRGTVWTGKVLNNKDFGVPNPENGCILSDILIEDAENITFPSSKWNVFLYKSEQALGEARAYSPK